MSAKISPQAFYDKFASDYDSILQGTQVNAQYFNEAISLFHKYHQGTRGTILDLGCGTGLLEDLLEGEFDYTGIDVAPNMLHYASKRGYKIIHKFIEEALPTLEDSSFDFVFALGSLLFIKDISPSLEHMNRIARRSILLSLDGLTQRYMDGFQVNVFDHSGVFLPEAQDDYRISGWTSPTTGFTINTRMIYIHKNSLTDT